MDEQKIARWYEEFFKMNPRRRKFRDLVVAYANEAGGVTREYFIAKWPYFWGVEHIDGAVERMEGLQLSKGERQEIFSDMLDSIWPEYSTSFEFLLHPNATDLNFPADIDA